MKNVLTNLTKNSNKSYFIKLRLATDPTLMKRQHGLASCQAFPHYIH